ncbi:predicted protein [Naegleria gruberi]|uniref:Predicted protein n=1 Tax=Naegleria gruberi TaxID=5762 RepID=D2W3M1_NAEGR|nr:uncharacterized protein NAEGRDRAFT_75991 [Naegleria gruberi]EFC36358.1 predicted protein [Naegleria gruberi]|eukprot:XP_002669102.1 predicted protein [Naegleria gruberi strain NEG-M]
MYKSAALKPTNFLIGILLVCLFGVVAITAAKSSKRSDSNVQIITLTSARSFKSSSRRRRKQTIKKKTKNDKEIIIKVIGKKKKKTSRKCYFPGRELVVNVPVPIPQTPQTIVLQQASRAASSASSSATTNNPGGSVNINLELEIPRGRRRRREVIIVPKPKPSPIPPLPQPSPIPPSPDPSPIPPKPEPSPIIPIPPPPKPTPIPEPSPIIPPNICSPGYIPSQFPLLKQCDSTWGSFKLGTSSETICKAGCLITSIISGLNGIGKTKMNPYEFNEWLKTNGGFQNKNLYVWAAITSKFGVKYYGRTTDILVVATRNLCEGKLVILKLIKPPGKKSEHFVLATGYDPVSKTFSVMDPYFDRTSYTVSEISRADSYTFK